MQTKLMTVLFVVALAFALSSVAYTQESAKTEDKKDEKHALKSVKCNPTCGFMVRSHDEKECIAMVKAHAKNVHNKEMTDNEVLAMMKTRGMKSSDKMEMKKKEKN